MGAASKNITRDWLAGSASGAHAFKRGRLCGPLGTKLAWMLAEVPEAAGRTRHGAQGCAPHRPIAPGIHGVRSPPRTCCFRGLFYAPTGLMEANLPRDRESPKNRKREKADVEFANPIQISCLMFRVFALSGFRDSLHQRLSIQGNLRPTGSFPANWLRCR